MKSRGLLPHVPILYHAGLYCWCGETRDPCVIAVIGLERRVVAPHVLPRFRSNQHFLLVRDPTLWSEISDCCAEGSSSFWGKKATENSNYTQIWRVALQSLTY